MVRPSSLCLRFHPLAWLKLKYFCHVGLTEIGGFAVTRADDRLYVTDFCTVKQQVTSVTVNFDDGAVADYFDQMVDAGLQPSQFGRIWLHTHPGNSPRPSGTDEATFARAFGHCDWAVMFILDRAGNTFARLCLRTEIGPVIVDLPVQIDWDAWPTLLQSETKDLAGCMADWAAEYAANVQKSAPPPTASAKKSLIRDPVESAYWEQARRQYEDRLIRGACVESDEYTDFRDDFDFYEQMFAEEPPEGELSIDEYAQAYARMEQLHEDC